MSRWQKDHESTRAAHAEYAEIKRAKEADVLAKIEKYAREGVSSMAIAERLGVSKSRVMRVRKALGLSNAPSFLYTLPNGTP